MDLILAYDYYKNIYLFMILGKCGSVIIRVKIIKKDDELIYIIKNMEN